MTPDFTPGYRISRCGSGSITAQGQFDLPLRFLFLWGAVLPYVSSRTDFSDRLLCGYGSTDYACLLEAALCGLDGFCKSGSNIRAGSGRCVACSFIRSTTLSRKKCPG